MKHIYFRHLSCKRLPIWLFSVVRFSYCSRPRRDRVYANRWYLMPPLRMSYINAQSRTFWSQRCQPVRSIAYKGLGEWATCGVGNRHLFEASSRGNVFIRLKWDQIYGEKQPPLNLLIQSVDPHREQRCSGFDAPLIFHSVHGRYPYWLFEQMP